ncbi:asparagine synthase-related protein [uncultured Roseovarius sp.]|uniref:asparagine synthase-related protein n=1 Tax=uncultured Roseovarius sp. TaxID=293344 RepID=UPI00262A9010|nr:asparagine synthase-related protein [uncultured Roseovarius sp.]
MFSRVYKKLRALRGGVKQSGRMDIATKPVEDFLVFRSSHSKVSKRVSQIFGAPMHSTRNLTLRQYTSHSLDEHLAKEGRFSLGNYILLDNGPGFCRIISSPGYCGGYFYAKDGVFVAGTTLVDVLRQIPTRIKMDPFGISFFLSHAPNSNFQQLPFSTMFEDVYRLPPGAVIEFDGGSITANYNYMSMASRLTPPRSFESAMHEVSARLGEHYRRLGVDKVGLMFSGGVDSLIIYLGLREYFPAEKIRCFTVEHSQSNGPSRALPIAERLGFELEVVPETVWNETDVVSNTIEMMKKDLTGTRSPHMALLANNLNDIDLLHGQNMDALVNIHMEILQSNLDLGFLSRSKAHSVITLEGVNRQLGGFVGNLQLTDAYLEDEGFQRISADFYALKHSPAKPDPEPGRDGMIRGMISHQFPNILSRSDFPSDQMAGLNRELALFREHAGHDLSPRMALDMIRYLTYCHLSGKRLSSLPIGQNSRAVLVSMSGPLLSYYLGKPRTMRDASMPKREIYGLTAKLAGDRYRQLTEGKGPNIKRKRDLSSMHEIIRQSRARLGANTARVLAAIDDEPTLSYVRKIHATVSGAKDLDHLSNFQLGQAIKLLNLELILDNAAQSGVEDAALEASSAA